MEYTIQKILEFHDLFPEENDLDVRRLLTKYSREYIVRCCHVLCNNYGNAAFIPDANNTFFSDVSKKHISNINSRLTRCLNTTGQNKVCYCTIKTALELMRIAFSIPIEEYRNDGLEEDFEYDLFRSVLMLNERLMNFSHVDQLDLPTLLFSCYYVQNDIINQDKNGTFVRQVIHYKKLSEFLTNHPQCVMHIICSYKRWGLNQWMSILKHGCR